MTTTTLPYPPSTCQIVMNAIAWANDAAKEHVDLATHLGESPDPEPSMGMWQSFQRAFPVAPGTDRDIIVAAYSAAYTEAVKALASAMAT